MVKLLHKLNLNYYVLSPTYACSCQILFQSDFKFCPCTRFGFGRCKASFLTLWEQTLCTSPKPSTAYLDGTTTVFNAKKKNLLSIFYLIKWSKKELPSTTLLSETWWPWRPPPPLVRNHAKTWQRRGRHRQKNIGGQLGLVHIDLTQRLIRKYIYHGK